MPDEPKKPEEQAPATPASSPQAQQRGDLSDALRDVPSRAHEASSQATSPAGLQPWGTEQKPDLPRGENFSQQPRPTEAGTPRARAKEQPRKVVNRKTGHYEHKERPRAPKPQRIQRDPGKRRARKLRDEMEAMCRRGARPAEALERVLHPWTAD